MAVIEIASQLVALETISFFIHSPLGIDTSVVSNDNYSVSIRQKLRASDTEQTISIILSIDLKSKADVQPDKQESRYASTDDELPSLHYEGMATFKIIDGLALKRDSKNRIFNIPSQYVNGMAEITYSTFRGIIFSKCEGSPLKNVMIPVLGPEQINEIMQINAKKSSESI